MLESLIITGVALLFTAALFLVAGLGAHYLTKLVKRLWNKLDD